MGFLDGTSRDGSIDAGLLLGLTILLATMGARWVHVIGLGEEKVRTASRALLLLFPHTLVSPRQPHPQRGVVTAPHSSA